MSAAMTDKLKGKLVPFRKGSDGVTSDLSDEALLAACALGEGTALAEIFQRHGDRVARVLARLPSVDRRDLDDLVQATFIEVHRSAAKFGGRAAVGTWILSIAVNVMRHHVRGEIRRRALVTAAAEEMAFASAPRPDDDASKRQLLARLERALASLPQDMQLVFSMCELEGIRGVEAARILGMREGTLWRKLHEARLRLRDALEPGGSA
jgi:RNA polymerase sigma-70 factor (ECF subfamily)